MAGRIPRVFINDLLARTDIVDLIDARVKLKKQGKNFHACCPFHNEKTPSFTVNGEKQFYHCFGCGAHGNAIDFLMNYDKLEFVETVEELAAMHNLEVPFEAGSGPSQIERHQRQTLYQLMDGLNTFYQQSLQQPVATSARQYLEKTRIKPRGYRSLCDWFCASRLGQRPEAVWRQSRKSPVID